jgi:hypothetical protein
VLAAFAELLRERPRVRDVDQEVEPRTRRLVRCADRGVGRAVEDEHAAGGRVASELADEPRLAGASLAGQEYEAALAAPGPLEQGAQRGELGGAPDERERRRGHERAGEHCSRGR